eukprot:95572-Prymnesium_polylepis.1
MWRTRRRCASGSRATSRRWVQSYVRSTRRIERAKRAIGERGVLVGGSILPSPHASQRGRGRRAGTARVHRPPATGRRGSAGAG